MGSLGALSADVTQANSQNLLGKKIPTVGSHIVFNTQKRDLDWYICNFS